MIFKAVNPCRRSDRRGFTLVEITIAVFLLAIAMALTAQVVGWLLSARRSSERRQWATREAAVVMERLSALPWGRLTADSVKDLPFSNQVGRELPRGELAVAVDEPPGAGSKRLSIRIRWRNQAGEWDAPVRLTAWVHRNGGQPR